MNLDQLGVQLYTLRSLTADDMLGTLRQVAAIGYRVVELVGYGNSTPTDIRAVLDELGMRAPAAHVTLDQLEQHAERVIADLKTLGCQYAVVPWLSEEYRGDVGRAQALAKRLNRIGQQFHDNGLRLAYHNHDFEFASLGNTTMWETLVVETDPALVHFELDVYWVVVAGRDPVTLIEQHGDRVKLLHLKDRSTQPGGTFAPVGSGSLAWEQILQAAHATEWYIVEQDTSDAPLDDVQRSFAYIQAVNAA